MPEEVYGFDAASVRRLHRGVRLAEGQAPLWTNRRQKRYPNPIDDFVYAQILGGSNPYSWIEMRATPSGGFEVMPDPYGVAGTTSQRPAYEFNDNPFVPAGAIVILWPAWQHDEDPPGQEWEFQYCCDDPLRPLDVVLNADVNNYAISNDYNWYRFAPSSNYAITGFAGGIEGRYFQITNKGPGTLTLPHESGSSSAGNRIHTLDGNSHILQPCYSALLKYAGQLCGSGTNRWIIAEAGLPSTIPIINGGTNSSTALNSNRIMISSAGKIVEASALTDGQILIGDTGAAPVGAVLTSTNSSIAITNGAGSIDLAQASVFTSGSGTTTDAYVQLSTYTNSGGLSLVFSIKNTGGSNGLTLKVDYTNLYGDSGSVTFNNAAGTYRFFDGNQDTNNTPPPWTTLTFSVKSQVAGNATTYSFRLSVF